MIDRECAIIGILLGELMTAEKRRQLIEFHRLVPECFRENSGRIAFEKIAALDVDDYEMVRLEVARAVGVEYAEKAIESAPVGPADAERAVYEFALDCQRERLHDAIETQFRFAGGKTSMEFLLSSLRGEIDKVERKASKDPKLDGTMLGDLTDPIPEDDNPDALFRGGWFRKGQAMFLVSVSGSGKSVITMQFCYAWALGRTALGIEPIRPMKIGVFQTEDDEEELKEFRDSMRRGYQHIHKWTKADLTSAEKNIKFFDPKGAMGEDFLKLLRAAQDRHNFDLVIINPLQGVTGFDISKNENLSSFLRGGIDPIIKGEKTRCGLFVVHHTNKPPNAQERVKFGRDQFAQYIGAGGAELNNWMRGMNIILPTDEPHTYRFVAAKRGERLGWKTPPHLKAVLPTKILAHSEPDPDGRRLLFWLDKTDDAANAKAAAEAAMESSPEENARVLASELQGQRLGATELRNACNRRFHRKNGTLVYDYICKNCKILNVIIELGSNNHQQFYRFPELPEKGE